MAVHASVLIFLGGVILFLIVGKLGGADAASATGRRAASHLLVRGEGEHAIGHMEFLTYMFVPLSVGMFPHLFQHWMTAKDVKTFRPVVILHPIFIMLVWAPCILLGIWASIATLNGMPVIPANLDEPEQGPGHSREEADQSRGRRLPGRGDRFRHHVVGLAVPRAFQHVHARHPAAGLR